MKEYIFTFTCGIDNPKKDCFVAINAESYMDARMKMIDVYGQKWAFQYESREAAGVYKFDLIELEF